MLEAAASPHCFPVRNELGFERNTFCKLEFSRWTKARFVEIGFFS
jgi:hypothetical protein